MNPELFLLFDALAVAVAAVIDVQQRRIPNWLTHSAIGMGLLLRAYYFARAELLPAGQMVTFVSHSARSHLLSITGGVSLEMRHILRERGPVVRKDMDRWTEF